MRQDKYFNRTFQVIDILMTRPIAIYHRYHQIEHLDQLGIIKPPDNGLRTQFYIGGTLLPHHLMFNSVEFEGCCTVFMCRSHRGLKHAYSILISV